MLTQERFDFFCRSIAPFGVEHAIVRKDGRELMHRDFVPETRQNQFSISKSITGTAVGFALEEGLIHLDDRIVDLLADELPAAVSPRLERLTIRHLLTMTIGQKKPYLMGNQRRTMQEKDYIRFVLSRPFEEEPGTVFLYSNAGPYLAGVILERASGERLPQYLLPRLFEPLDISLPEWETDPLGNTFGAGGIELSSTEVSRFGELYLQDGVWNGRQILPKSWVRLVDRTVIPVPDGIRDYGMLFWRGRYDSLSAVGRFGQYCTILKEKNAVIVLNSNDPGENNLLEYVWTYLYPYL
ncbi:serine hydrolase domain-containing protein [Hominifimenecus sp. rT4P-3]|uniref:serine hydrolase domain-containing protein n=1 Tax=Hominifimenecus sp. rT4P-3 TaxID=3242979 RepID=UPI003DA3700A